MAVSSTSNTNVYSLSEFLNVFELPKYVEVTEGYVGRDDNTTIAKDEVLFLMRKKSVCCLSGVTAKGKHKVSIPIDCQQKVEIPSPHSMHESVSTVKELVGYLPRVKHVRVLHDYRSRNEEEVVKASELLELLFVDTENQTLTTINNQGCEVRLPMSCSAGFNLLSYGEEYLLADLLAKDLLPMTVRFVNPIPPDIRETFFEENRDCSLDVLFLEKKLIEHSCVEATFNDPEKGILISRLPCDLDITVSLMESNSRAIKPKQVGAVSDAELQNSPESRRKQALVLPQDEDSHLYEIVNDSESDDERKLEKLKAGVRVKATTTLKKLKKINLSKRKSRSNHSFKATRKELIQGAASSVCSFEKESSSLPALRYTVTQRNGNPDKSFPSKALPKVGNSDAIKANVCQITSIYEEVGKYGSSTAMHTPGSSKDDSLEDVPLDLSALSQKDVISLLQKMNLGEHVKTFAFEQVDGTLLMELDQDILTKEFGLHKFHAWKLSRFIKGWRPQLSRGYANDHVYEECCQK